MPKQSNACGDSMPTRIKACGSKLQRLMHAASSTSFELTLWKQVDGLKTENDVRMLHPPKREAPCSRAQNLGRGKPTLLPTSQQQARACRTTHHPMCLTQTLVTIEISAHVAATWSERNTASSLPAGGGESSSITLASTIKSSAVGGTVTSNERHGG